MAKKNTHTCPEKSKARRRTVDRLTTYTNNAKLAVRDQEKEAAAFPLCCETNIHTYKTTLRMIRRLRGVFFSH